MTPLRRIVVCVLAAIAQIPASHLLAAERVRSLNDLTGSWQLFVDDGVVAAKDNVVRSYHPFEKDSRNPLIRADRPWEGNNVYLYG